ncbi:acyl esterase [Streptomyces sp. So13.3]|uniref:CocE/NonD family hydrolase n=1 Tax=Streptomyces TaxID=1883 RepID=UPI001106637A|nr:MULTISPECIES: CocE/NonD family hydrolase [Streptomyces]MCZ4103186.1 acyl esterase [Streptomyces sp. H39-C1]QNA76030.1 acyl esterase [Streptomyces sp. So13.3]
MRATTAGVVGAALLASTAFGLAPLAQAAPAPTVVTAASAQAAAASTFRFVDIPGSGGITLKGNVFTPGGYDGSQRYPVVVLPSSWAINDLEYVAQAKQLADSGYVVVSYTSRGFWLSGGQIETAGPPDVADVSKVIDWTLANTPADPDHIGMAGVSYGAGIGLLGAAHDPRIKAVVALSGWADLIDSIYQGRTPHLQAAALLGGAGYLTGRPSPELQKILGNFLTANLAAEDEMIAWGKLRSPVTYLDQLNANGTAVMLANAWGDSLFPPNQYAKFYEKLTGPKRLEFRPGDHATAEATGLLGLPNDTWASSRRWLDHYLKGVDNGIDHEQPVQLKSRSTGAYESYDSWSAVPSRTTTLKLGAKGLRTGELGGDAGSGWRTTIGTNVDSGADGGIIFLSSLLDQFAQAPPVASIPLLPRAFATVWQSAAYGTAQHVRGTSTLHTTLTPSAAGGTVIAYLYDVDSLGIGKLVTHAPYTWVGRTPGKAFTTDIDLLSTAYDVPAGHRLALVVDTVDPLYIEQNPLFSTVTVSSPASDPSWLSVPLHDQ